MATAKAKFLGQLQSMLGAGKGNKLLDRQLLEQFTTERNQAAFAALVRRHGPMVLNVCRRVLHNTADAEDAFQATFLVLARKAATVGKREALAAWLHQVAYRMALRTRTGASRRRQHERRTTGRQCEDPLAAITGRELLTVLDEELHALPAHNRGPLILCYLEEQTRDEAARQLGLSVRTLTRRLENGRATLRRRLERRGLALSAAFLTLDSLQSTATAAVPALLAATVTKAAMQVAAGKGLAEIASAHVAALVTGTLRAMAVAKAFTSATLIATVALVGVGIGMGAYVSQKALGERRDPSLSRPTQQVVSRGAAPAEVKGLKSSRDQLAPLNREDAEPVKAGDVVNDTAIAGQVVGADEKPVEGAQVGVIIAVKNPIRPLEWGDQLTVLGPVKTDGQGRFSLPSHTFAWKRYARVQLIATATEHGLAWKDLLPAKKTSEILVHLPKEQIIRGRLVDLQGQPAAQVEVYFPSMANRKNGPALSEFWPRPALTDPQGRFVFRGIGLEDAGTLQVFHEHFSRQRLGIDKVDLTREHTWTLAPARIIEGRVLAGDTGKPMPHARLSISASEKRYGPRNWVEGEADDHGRFRLNPYAGSYFLITTSPPDGEPYLVKHTELNWPKAAVHQELTITVPPGVLIRGKVTDAATGQPIAGTGVHFHGRDIVNERGKFDPGTSMTDATGLFRIAVPPGQGYLAFVGPTDDYIQLAMPSNKVLYDRPGGLLHYAHAWHSIQAKLGAQRDIAVTLRRGITVRGRLVHADGTPVAEARMVSKRITPLAWFSPFSSYRPNGMGLPVHAGKFELHGLDPDETCSVLFLDAKNLQGAVAQVSAREHGSLPMTIRLSPCGSATVRYVDAKGKPVVGLAPGFFEIVLMPGVSVYDMKARDQGKICESTEFVGNFHGVPFLPPRTDAQGQVTLRALVPGATYLLRDSSTLSSQEPPALYFNAESGKEVRLPDIHWRASQSDDIQPEDTVSIRGQIIGADGKPVPGAQVAVVTEGKNSGRGADLSNPMQIIGPVTADHDGRYRLQADHLDWQRYWEVQVVAAAPGHGLGWRKIHLGDDLSLATVKLPREQVFRGRLVDLQGQPAAGVPVRLFFVGAAKRGRADGVRIWAGEGHLSSWPAPVTTDEQGRFVIRGIGVDLTLGLDIDDERFARQWLSPLDNKAGAEEVTRTLAPAHLIEGQVIAADTKKPVPHAGLTVYAAEKELGGMMGVSGRTDAQGRFRINPHPGSIFHIKAFPPESEPYLSKEIILNWPKGAVKQQVTVAVPSGAVIRGKVSDAVSGKPIAGTNVHFLPREKSNPNVRDNVDSTTGVTDTNGVFHMTVVPGQGYLAFVAAADHYIQTDMQTSKIYYDKPGGALYPAHAWRFVDAKLGTPQELDVMLRPGVTLRGKLLDSEGKPVAEGVMFGPLFSRNGAVSSYRPKPLSIPVHAGQFEIHGLDPDQTYPVFFLEPKNKQGVIANLSGKQAAAGPVTVRLSPCGSAVVRFVDARGKPVVGLSNFAFQIQIRLGVSQFDRTALAKGLVMESTEFVGNWDRLNYWDGPATDGQGQVTLPALIPGAKYAIPASNVGSKINPPQYFQVEAGQTLKLPDIQWNP
jgi:RNA polymerase sigma factor (sigma-70 family)